MNPCDELAAYISQLQLEWVDLPEFWLQADDIALLCKVQIEGEGH